MSALIWIIIEGFCEPFIYTDNFVLLLISFKLWNEKSLGSKPLGMKEESELLLLGKEIDMKT